MFGLWWVWFQRLFQVVAVNCQAAVQVSGWGSVRVLKLGNSNRLQVILYRQKCTFLFRKGDKDKQINIK